MKAAQHSLVFVALFWYEVDASHVSVVVVSAAGSAMCGQQHGAALESVVLLFVVLFSYAVDVSHVFVAILSVCGGVWGGVQCTVSSSDAALACGCCPYVVVGGCVSRFCLSRRGHRWFCWLPLVLLVLLLPCSLVMFGRQCRAVSTPLVSQIARSSI